MAVVHSKLAKNLDAFDKGISKLPNAVLSTPGIDSEKINIVNVNTATAKPKSGSTMNGDIFDRF